MAASSIEHLRNYAVSEDGEYEFALGTAQVASLSFVALVLISLLVGISYMAGRATAARNNAAPKDAAPVTAVSSPPLPGAAEQPVVVAASLADPPALSSTNKNDSKAAQLFAEPVKGAIYIQTGAVERGVAAIMAEGLRTHGLNAFVAAGPSDKIYRVLTGPFPNLAAYQSAKATLDAIGLSSFAQQYQK